MKVLDCFYDFRIWIIRCFLRMSPIFYYCILMRNNFIFSNWWIRDSVLTCWQRIMFHGVFMIFYIMFWKVITCKLGVCERDLWCIFSIASISNYSTGIGTSSRLTVMSFVTFFLLVVCFFLVLIYWW